MSRKAPAKKPAPSKPSRVYIVVREIDGETVAYTEPDRVFASKGAALKYAKQLNRELRDFTRPFDDNNEPDWLMSGGEKALLALLDKLGLTAPTAKSATDAYIDWGAWWDRTYFEMSETQRDAIWDALDEFKWYKVKQTTLEG